MFAPRGELQSTHGIDKRSPTDALWRRQGRIRMVPLQARVHWHPHSSAVVFVIVGLTVSACFFNPTDGQVLSGTSTGDASSTGAPAVPTSGADIPSTASGDASGSGTSATATDNASSTGTSSPTAPPSAPQLTLSFSQIKQFDFEWPADAAAEYYQLLERPRPGADYAQLGEDIVGESVSWTMPLHFRFEASYVLRACNSSGCTESAAVNVVDSLSSAVGYVKASNTNASDAFGYSVALSGDGNTLAVGAPFEGSAAVGIDGDQSDGSMYTAGAVYVFTRNGETWSQVSYVKASNTDSGDHFGVSVALSRDGDTLAVGARYEDSAATGVGGDPSENSAKDAGAAYLFVRNAGIWSQQAYIKASNTDASAFFGDDVAISDDGNTLAVSAFYEDGAATGIDGDQSDDSKQDAGAAYVFTRNGGTWSQQAYVKASNTDAFDGFAYSLALSGDGDTLAVGASYETSAATDIDGDQSDNSAKDAGAVYVFVRTNGAWTQQAYIKASNTRAYDAFGRSVAISDDGNTLAVGARGEDSAATGIDGDQSDDSKDNAGAVYVFVRSTPNSTWSQAAYVKASNTDAQDYFGASLVLSGDGNTLAVGAYGEHSTATGIDGEQVDNTKESAGAVYVLVRDVNTWSQRSYVKASNTDSNDSFGESLSMSDDGSMLAVGAKDEDGAAIGIAGDQTNNSALSAGAVYLY